jgi:hypothetical protein
MMITRYKRRAPSVPHHIFLQNFVSAKHLGDVKELGVPNHVVTLADEGPLLSRERQSALSY